MRIFFDELHKLFHSAAFLFVTVAVILLNAYAGFSSNIGNAGFPDKSYKSLYSDVSQMSFHEAEVFLQGKIDTLLPTSDFYYTQNLWSERELLSSQFAQLQAVKNYETYLDGIEASAKAMVSVSIFSDKNSFFYRNIILTPAQYEGLHGVEPSFEPSYGIILASSSTTSDLLSLFVVVTAVVILFCKEKEGGILTLIKSTKNGRQRLALAKTGVIFAVCVFAVMILFGSNLFIGSIRFGLGNFLRPIQSVEGFIGCCLPLNVLQFLLLTYVIKIFAVFLAAVVFQLLCIKLRSVWAFCAFFIIGGIETALYLFISQNSSFSVLKQLNSSAFLNSARLFEAYTNINLFGYPMNLISSSTICMAAEISAAVFFTAYLFSHIDTSAAKKSRCPVSVSYIPKKAFSYAVYKAFIMHRGAVLILVVIAVQLYGALSYNPQYNTDDNYYKTYCETISVLSDEEANKYISSETERFALLEKQLRNASGFSESLSYIAAELNAEQGFEQAKEQYFHITELKNTGIKNAPMFYQSGYKVLFGISGFQADMTLALIMALALCFCVSPIIAFDRRSGICSVLFASKAGRTGYIKHNLTVCSIQAAAVSLSVNIPYIIQILSAYGNENPSASIRCIFEFKSFADMTIAQYIAFLLISRIIGCVILSVIILWISSKCKSPTTAMIVSAAVFALPIVIYLAGGGFMLDFCAPFSISREIISGRIFTPAIFAAFGIICLSLLRRTYKNYK